MLMCHFIAFLSVVPGALGVPLMISSGWNLLSVQRLTSFAVIPKLASLSLLEYTAPKRDVPSLK